MRDDGGFDGTVVFTHAALKGSDALKRMARSMPKPGWPVQKWRASAPLSVWAAKAEFLAGVPGTIGGALAMNAGCYGTET